MLSSGLVKPRILLAAVSVASYLATGTILAQTSPDARQAIEPVMKQLDALRRDDYETAYTFASTTVQEMFDRQAFERMVRTGTPRSRGRLPPTWQRSGSDPTSTCTCASRSGAPTARISRRSTTGVGRRPLPHQRRRDEVGPRARLRRARARHASRGEAERTGGDRSRRGRLRWRAWTSTSPTRSRPSAAKCASWLAANVPAELKGRGFASSRGDVDSVVRLRGWQRRLHEAGYVGMDWPTEFGGRGASIMEQIIFYEEMSRAEAPQPLNRSGLSMLGPTLMRHGTPAQRERHLKILTAEEIWCQGFSEPNAGSDLANVQTRAVLDGDHYVVNGQKVWTSMAHVADWGFFLVRTDARAQAQGHHVHPDRHEDPGISIRPLRQITGEAEFNEVFLEDVRVPVANVVGKVNEGWSVAITTLAYERDVLTMIRHISLRTALERLVALAKRTKQTATRRPTTR